MTRGVTPVMLSLAALENINSKAQQAESDIRGAVKAAREAHASWAEIGKALGVTRQAAWEKYKGLDGEIKAEHESASR